MVEWVVESLHELKLPSGVILFILFLAYVVDQGIKYVATASKEKLERANHESLSLKETVRDLGESLDRVKTAHSSCEKDLFELRERVLSLERSQGSKDEITR